MHFDVRPDETPVDPTARALLLEAPASGAVFSDHMMSASWTEERGWHDGRLSA